MVSTVPTVGTGSADKIDYEIHGQEMQFVAIELAPGKSVIAEAGSMMYKKPAINLDAEIGRWQSEILRVLRFSRIHRQTLPARRDPFQDRLYALRTM